jgi:hypothetical protein
MKVRRTLSALEAIFHGLGHASLKGNALVPDAITLRNDPASKPTPHREFCLPAP